MMKIKNNTKLSKGKIMKKIFYCFLLIFSILMLFGGINEVTQNKLTFIDIFMFAIFISLIVFSIVKLFKHNHLDYKSNKSILITKIYLILRRLSLTLFNQMTILGKIISHMILKLIILKSKTGKVNYKQ